MKLFNFLKDIEQLKKEVYEDGVYQPAWSRDTVYERLEDIEETLEAILNKLGVYTKYVADVDSFAGYTKVCVDIEKVKSKTKTTKK